jgi:hypothetical protein
LLLTLLPVFAGLPGAEELFMTACLVVMLSVVVHGTGIAFFLRANAEPRGSTVPSAPASTPTETVPERITVEELRALQASGEPVVIVDARADRSYASSDIAATNAIRLRPDDPVRDATAKRLSQRATLVVYCA